MSWSLSITHMAISDQVIMYNISITGPQGELCFEATKSLTIKCNLQ